MAVSKLRIPTYWVKKKNLFEKSVGNHKNEMRETRYCRLFDLREKNLFKMSLTSLKRKPVDFN